MKLWMPALFIVLPLVGSGCGFAQNVRRNVVFSPLYAATDCCDYHRSTLLAREAWREMAAEYADEEFSCDYREGFVKGFADFLEYGGSGEPLPAPPPMYRLFGYMTPEGLRAMEDFKIGWRHGASSARASGLRELIVLPVWWGPEYPQVPQNRDRKKWDADKKEDTEAKPTLKPEDAPKDKPVDVPAEQPREMRPIGRPAGNQPAGKPSGDGIMEPIRPAELPKPE